MGMWDSKPWDNDSASDWYADLLTDSDFINEVEKGLQLDVEEYFEEVRAAAHIVIQLCRTYIWPIDLIDKHLALALKGLEYIRDQELLEDYEEAEEELAKEIAELKSRI